MSVGILKRTADWMAHWRAERRSIGIYATNERTPFFREALKWLPEGKVTAIDVGGGLSNFAELALAQNPSASVWILDGNPDTVETLKESSKSALLYQARGRLPFADGAVALIHCSHVIEHLPAPDLYFMLGEFKRVLAADGILVISAPLLWGGFYNDLSHVRPYPPEILDKYLVGGDVGLSYSRRRIGGFKREALTYRYVKTLSGDNAGLRSEHAIADLVLCTSRRLLARCGFFHLEKTGFTVSYRRSDEPGMDFNEVQAGRA